METGDNTKSLIEVIWQFVRGDWDAAEFEKWVYSEPALESFLGETLYLETISTDYNDKKEVSELRNSLEKFARAKTALSCQCITLPELVAVDIAGCEWDEVMETLEERGHRGGDSPEHAYQCTICGQWWLYARCDNHDVVYLKRLSLNEGLRIVQHGKWPKKYFESYAYLLRFNGDRPRPKLGPDIPGITSVTVWQRVQNVFDFVVLFPIVILGYAIFMTIYGTGSKKEKERLRKKRPYYTNRGK